MAVYGDGFLPVGAAVLLGEVSEVCLEAADIPAVRLGEGTSAVGQVLTVRPPGGAGRRAPIPVLGRVLAGTPREGVELFDSR
jgi:hypothetical protein